MADNGLLTLPANYPDTYDHIANLELNTPESGLKTVFTTQEGEDQFIHFGEQTFGPFVPGEYYQFKQNSDGAYAFVAQDKSNNAVYVNVNGKNYPPVLGSTYDISILLNGTEKFMYRYRDVNDQSMYVNVCGKSYGPYNEVEDYNMNVISPDNYFFRYNVDGAWYVNHSEQIYGPYSSVYLFTVKDNPWFIAENKKGYFTLINGQETGPYDNVWWTTEDSRSQGTFFYTQKKKPYRVDDGQVNLESDETYASGDYETIRNYEFDREISYSYKTGNVICNGQVYDGAAKDAFNFYLDEIAETFVWFSLDGRQLRAHSLPAK